MVKNIKKKYNDFVKNNGTVLWEYLGAIILIGVSIFVFTLQDNKTKTIKNISFANSWKSKCVDFNDFDGECYEVERIKNTKSNLLKDNNSKKVISILKTDEWFSQLSISLYDLDEKNNLQLFLTDPTKNHKEWYDFFTNEFYNSKCTLYNEFNIEINEYTAKISRTGIFVQLKNYNSFNEGLRKTIKQNNSYGYYLIFDLKHIGKVKVNL